MTRDMVDASDLNRLSADLGKISGATSKALFGVFEKGADDLRDEWRRNARETSGKAAARYPSTITARRNLALGGIEFEVGPDARVNKQANLGAILEYGTATNPPHLDGQRAADATAPKLEKAVGKALDGLLGDI